MKNLRVPKIITIAVITILLSSTLLSIIPSAPPIPVGAQENEELLVPHHRGFDESALLW
jgi:hypothetical protein